MPEQEKSTWACYRCWKIRVAPLLGLVAYVLLYDDFQPSLRLYLGIAIGAGLGIAYIAEEIFWIVRNQGRPCANCGASVRLRPFRVKATCPRCGAALR